MRDSNNAFHLAIPCRDLDEAWVFYIEDLGCEPGRRYDDRIMVNFFGDQVVCHLSPEKVDAVAEMYPRHFGIAIHRRAEFDRIHERALNKGLAFFEPLFIRFPEEQKEHQAFFLVDSSNNLIEFKHYSHPESMY